MYDVSLGLGPALHRKRLAGIDTDISPHNVFCGRHPSHLTLSCCMIPRHLADAHDPLPSPFTLYYITTPFLAQPQTVSLHASFRVCSLLLPLVPVPVSNVRGLRSYSSFTSVTRLN